MENGIVKPMVRSLLISYVLSGILLAPWHLPCINCI